MAFTFGEATRTKSKLRVGLFGPSGAGKTMSALRMAFGFCGDWKKVGFIDTERGSGALYEGVSKEDPQNRQQFSIGKFLHGCINAPFTPEKYIEAIRAFEQAGVEVIVIDSISHEWEGKGGILETIDAMPGNSFTNWGKVTPRHNKFIDAILESPCHIICCSRSKQDYVLSESTNKHGNKVQVPEKVGLKAVTREGFEYEMTLALDIDIRHNARSTKDRTGLFDGKPEFVISEECGRDLIAWVNGDISEPKAAPDPQQQDETKAECMQWFRAVMAAQAQYGLTAEDVKVHGQCDSLRVLIDSGNAAELAAVYDRVVEYGESLPSEAPVAAEALPA